MYTGRFIIILTLVHGLFLVEFRYFIYLVKEPMLFINFV